MLKIVKEIMERGERPERFSRKSILKNSYPFQDG
jgi:hypothetical protein